MVEDELHNSKWIRFVLELVGLGVFATGFWVFGEHLDKHGFPLLANFLNFLACWGFFAIVPVAVLKFWPHPKMVWPTFGVLSLGFALIWWIIASNKESTSEPQRPHFTFSVRTPETSVKDRLILTNDCFIDKNVPWGTIARCCLVMPLKLGESNVTLIFTAENDSPMVAEFVELHLQVVPHAMSMTPSMEWHKSASPSQYFDMKVPGVTNDFKQEFTFNAPYAVLPRHGQDAPPITFAPPDINSINNAAWPSLLLTAEAKDAIYSKVGFNLLVSSSPKVTRPAVVGKHMLTNGTEWINAKDLISKPVK